MNAVTVHVDLTSPVRRLAGSMTYQRTIPKIRNRSAVKIRIAMLSPTRAILTGHDFARAVPMTHKRSGAIKHTAQAKGVG